MMLSETSAALRDAGASEKEIAGFEKRLGSIDNPLSRLEARYSMLRWMVGVNVAATLAILRRRRMASVAATLTPTIHRSIEYLASRRDSGLSMLPSRFSKPAISFSDAPASRRAAEVSDNIMAVPRTHRRPPLCGDGAGGPGRTRTCNPTVMSGQL